MPEANGLVVSFMIGSNDRASIFRLIWSYLDFLCGSIGMNFAFVVEREAKALWYLHDNGVKRKTKKKSVKLI
jgi:hypothetical protein